MANYVNDIILAGKIIAPATFCYRKNNTVYYKFTVLVIQSNGSENKIPVIIPESFITEQNMTFQVGSQVKLHGSLGYSDEAKRNGAHRFVYAKRVKCMGQPERFNYVNSVRLEGTVSHVAEPSEGRATRIYIMPKEDDNSSFRCAFWNLSEEQKQKIQVGRDIYVTGSFNVYEYKRVRDEKVETRVEYCITASELFL